MNAILCLSFLLSDCSIESAAAISDVLGHPVISRGALLWTHEFEFSTAEDYATERAEDDARKHIAQTYLLDIASTTGAAVAEQVEEAISIIVRAGVDPVESRERQRAWARDLREEALCR